MRLLSATLSVAFCAWAVEASSTPENLEYDATVCMGCTLVLSLLEQAQFPRLEDWLIKEVCDDSRVCEAGVKEVVQMVEGQLDPDLICQDLTLCDGTCALYTEGDWPPAHVPSPPKSEYGGSRRLRGGALIGAEQVAAGFKKMAIKGYMGGLKTAANMAARIVGHSECGLDEECMLRNIPEEQLGGLNPCGSNITCIITRVFDEHRPLVDGDGDNFAPPGGLLENTFRGAHWRGRDCDDSDPNIHPGRKAIDGDAEVDSNCNGIYGANETGTYEDMFCSDTQQRGIVILGDSATAHFHIPPQWLTADGWDLAFLPMDGMNELDNPACSWGTGYVDEAHCPYSAAGHVESLYERFRERNLCIHRDFQNMGVNGARSSSALGLVDGMARDAENDNPLLVVLSLIGNDVCNGHAGSSHMTTVEEFETNTRATLAELDKRLPADSVVVTVGLVDGRILYENMHDQQHPTGSDYSELYTYLSCNGENPCWGWLNTNETWRNFTSERAANLTTVYQKLVDEQGFDNFKLYTIAPDWQGFIQKYVEAGGVARDIIEPVDGFHESTAGSVLLAQDFWDILESDHPEVLGEVNPHNDEIKAMFGDQGGY